LFLAKIDKGPLNFGNLERSFPGGSNGGTVLLVASGDGNDSAGSTSESDVPSGDTRSRRGVSASIIVAKSNEPGEDDGESSPASSGGSPSTRGATASSNWAGSPVQGDDDDKSVEDATYTPSGGAPATCGVATRGAAALDGKMRSLASEGDDGSGAAGNFSRPSGARSRRGVALPSSSEEALKGYDGGRSLGIAGDDKIPSRTRPRRGVPLPSDSEEALKGYDGDPGAAYHSTVPSGARSRRGVALPSDSGEALKGYDGGCMSGSRGSNKLFSGSATDISTTVVGVQWQLGTLIWGIRHDDYGEGLRNMTQPHKWQIAQRQR